MIESSELSSMAECRFMFEWFFFLLYTIEPSKPVIPSSKAADTSGKALFSFVSGRMLSRFCWDNCSVATEP